MLKEIPKQALIDGGVMEAKAVYDFGCWYCALVTKKEPLEKMIDDCIRLEEMIKGIQDKFLVLIKEVYEQEVLDGDGMSVDNLQDKVRSNFFPATGSISTSHMNNVASFIAFMENFRKQEVEWKKLFATCAESLEVIEFKLDIMPSVSMEELEMVMSRFIVFALRERDKGNIFLDDSLLQS